MQNMSKRSAVWRGGSLGAKISAEMAIPEEFSFVDRKHVAISSSEDCIICHLSRFDTVPACDWRTDTGQAYGRKLL